MLLRVGLFIDELRKPNLYSAFYLILYLERVGLIILAYNKFQWSLFVLILHLRIYIILPNFNFFFSGIRSKITNS